MKRCSQAIACAMGMVLLAGTTNAANADVGNPYADSITNRNVFGLKSPPPPPNPEDLVKKDPPPKILLQGLTTILGRRQVLFKVQVPAKPGQPASEQSYVLTEGERQDEIEVLEIDETGRVVKFNNHGTVESKNMKDDVAKATAAPPPPALPRPGVPAPALPGIPRPTAAVNPATSGSSVVTSFGAGSRQIPTRTLRTSTATPGSQPVGFGGLRAGQTAEPRQAAPQPLNREEQAVMIEVQRELHRDTDISKLLPPTPLTPQPPTPQ